MVVKKIHKKGSNINKYLEEIGRISIYTKEEERAFFKELEKKSLVLWGYIFNIMYYDNDIHLKVIDIFSKRTTKVLLGLVKEFNYEKINIEYLNNIISMVEEKELLLERDAEIKSFDDIKNNLKNFEEISEFNEFYKNDRAYIFQFIQDSIVFLLDNLFYFDGFIEFKLFFEDKIINNLIDPPIVDDFEKIYQRELFEVDRLKNKFATANLKLVVSVSKYYMKSSLPWGDVIQEGNIGLLRAIEKFDYKTGNRFSTYGIWWIRQSIVRAIIEKAGVIRIPLHLIDGYNKIKRVILNYMNLKDRLPETDEISKETNIPEVKIRKILSYLSLEVVSLSSPIGNKYSDNPIRFEDIIEDFSNENPLKRLEDEFIASSIKEHLDKLGDMEKTVLRLRYGFGGDESMTLEEIGNRYNLSRERIRQIQEKALVKLRTLIRKNKKIFKE